MKIGSLKIDSAAIEQGRWVEDTGLPGVRIKTRGTGNSDYRRLQQKMLREVTAGERINGVSPERSDEMVNRLLVETCIQDWSGLENDDGSPLEFSCETAATLIADPDLRPLRDALLLAADRVGAQAEADEKADAKN